MKVVYEWKRYSRKRYLNIITDFVFFSFFINCWLFVHILRSCMIKSVKKVFLKITSSTTLTSLWLYFHSNWFSNYFGNNCITRTLFLKNTSNPTGIQLPWQLNGNEARGVRDVIYEKGLLICSVQNLFLKLFF